MRLIHTLFLCAAGFFAIALSPSAQARWNERTLAADGVTRVYRVYTPLRLRAGAPAVVVLHGGGQSAWKIFEPRAGATLQWQTIADREGVVLLVPNGTERETGDPRGDKQNWNDLRNDQVRKPVDDVLFLSQMVAAETQALKLDRQHIYITGASNGGMMTYRMLIEAPQLFAAGAAFIATLPENLAQVPQPAKPTPLMIMNGTADKLVPWNGGAVAGDAQRGRTSSSPDTLRWWLAQNRAATDGERTQLPDASPADGCTLTLDRYRPMQGGAGVWMYTVNGGGHSTPTIAHNVEHARFVRNMIGQTCSDVEGAEVAWQFFKLHSR